MQIILILRYFQLTSTSDIPPTPAPHTLLDRLPTPPPQVVRVGRGTDGETSESVGEGDFYGKRKK